MQYRVLLIVFSILVYAFALGLARAADITIRDLGGSDLPAIITIQGRLLQGDHNKFLNALASIPHAMVYLDSPGGAAGEAIQIGMTIRLRHFETAVPYRATCASACALIWLGGTHRRAGDGATIGFHAVSNKGKASPKGNAAVVRYLDWLGLHVAAEYVTGTPPQSMTVLTREKATNYDINYDPFTLDEINRYHKVRDKHVDPPLIIHDPGLPSIE